VVILAEELDVKILEEEKLSNPEAYELLKKTVDKILEKEASVPPFLSKTLEYLKKFSKIDAETARALKKRLEEYSLKEETIVMIVNICPQTLDELRPLLELEEKFVETETAKKILEEVRKYCKLEET
jgi:DNA-directed RNA polymerase subunit F